MKLVELDEACSSARSTRASRAARRSATRSSTWRCSSRASRCSTRPTRASTSTPCASSPTASTRCARADRAFLVITHYQRLLNYIVPDFVHVLIDGRIVPLRRQGARARARGARATPGSRPSRARRRSAAGREVDVRWPLPPSPPPFARRARRGRRLPRRSPAVVAAAARRGGRALRASSASRPRAGGVALHQRGAGGAHPLRAHRRRRPRAAGRRARRPPICSATPTELVFVDGRLAPELSRSAGCPRASSVGSLAARLARDAGDASSRTWLGTPRLIETSPSSRSTPPCSRTARVVRIGAGAVVEPPGPPASSSSTGATERPTASLPARPDRGGTRAPGDRGRDAPSAAAATTLTCAVTEIVARGRRRARSLQAAGRRARRHFHLAGVAVAAGSRQRTSRLARRSRSAAASCATTSAPCSSARAGVATLERPLPRLAAASTSTTTCASTTPRPHCTSHELYKGILDGRARAVFNGRISSTRARRRPTPSRPTATSCCRTRRSPTPTRSSRSSPTTSAARTARRSASSTTTRCSTCARAASASRRRGAS